VSSCAFYKIVQIFIFGAYAQICVSACERVMRPFKFYTKLYAAHIYPTHTTRLRARAPHIHTHTHTHTHARTHTHAERHMMYIGQTKVRLLGAIFWIFISLYPPPPPFMQFIQSLVLCILNTLFFVIVYILRLYFRALYCHNNRLAISTFVPIIISPFLLILIYYLYVFVQNCIML